MVKSLSLCEKEVQRMIQEGTPNGNKIHITLPAQLVKSGESRQLSVYSHEAKEIILGKMRQMQVATA